MNGNKSDKRDKIVMNIEVYNMLKAIVFDVDNTIFDSKLGKVPEQTLKLLKELSARQDVYLGLATGRGRRKLDIIEDILPLFDFKVLLNGAVVLKGDDIIFDEPIKIEDIIDALDKTKGHDLNVGMVGIDNEAVNYWDDRVGYGMKVLRGVFPKVDPEFYLKSKIYQLWMFADYESEILEIAKDIPAFRVYPWHHGGADFNYPHINKSYGIKKALETLPECQLICVGDGYNDIGMLEIADISIAMDNTRFSELKEKADHIAPAIAEDQLYAFFKSLHLI